MGKNKLFMDPTQFQPNHKWTTYNFWHVRKHGDYGTIAVFRSMEVFSADRHQDTRELPLNITITVTLVSIFDGLNS